MAEEKISQKFRLVKIDEKRSYFIEEMKQKMVSWYSHRYRMF